jgi:hypothetical protein
MIETGLVYVHAIAPAKRFVGYGALIEGGYVATCRHVWRMATQDGAAAPAAVEIAFPRARPGGVAHRESAHLAGDCLGLDDLPPDLVLLRPAGIPAGMMTLPLASHDRFEAGPGYAIAGLVGRDAGRPDGVRDAKVKGEIAEEAQARARRMVPLLKERAAVERISFDHESAKATLTEITALDRDDVWSWVELGELWELTGPLDKALAAYANAEEAARRTGAERDQAACHAWIGDVKRAHGDLQGALDAYTAALGIRETLARRDPGNTAWQRDLVVSCVKIADCVPAEARGLLERALGVVRELQETGRLAPVDAWMPGEVAQRLAVLPDGASGR